MSYPPPQGSQPYAQGYPPQGGYQDNYQAQSALPGGANDHQADYKTGPQGGQLGGFAVAAPPPQPKFKFKDPVFAVLWILVFGGFVAVSVISLRGYVSAGATARLDSGGPNNFLEANTLNGETASLLTLSCGVALLFSILYLLAVRYFTRFILEATLLINTLATVAYCVFLWVKGQTTGAIIFTIFAVLSVIAYWFMRKKIPLAKLLLRAVLSASNTYKATYVAALLGTLVQAAFSVWTAWTLVAIYVRFSGSGGTGGSRGSGATTGLVVLTIFNWYWTSELIKAIAFTTTAGTFGVWYYSNDSKKVPHATLSSFKRASTWSLGSLAFGSLVLAILDIIRALINILSQQAAQDGDMIGVVVGCIASCLIATIDWLIEFFNRLAYVNIALYGNGYIGAAKETWRLVKQKGVDALIQDSLVNTVFGIGSFVIAILCGITVYAYLTVVNPTYVRNDSNYFSVVILYAILLGFQIALSMGSSINSGVLTLFVGLAEDPHVLAQRDPELFEAIRQQYPQVVNAVA